MSTILYYDIDGLPITEDEWRQTFADPDARRINHDKHGGVEVSTVLLGLDHNWGDGPPLIFETMIFGGDHDQEQWRYTTQAQAEEGHQRACLLAFSTEGR